MRARRNSSSVILETHGRSALHRAGSGLGVPSALICSICVTKANPFGMEEYDHLGYSAARKARSSMFATLARSASPFEDSHRSGIVVSADAAGGGHGNAGGDGGGCFEKVKKKTHTVRNTGNHTAKLAT